MIKHSKTLTLKDNVKKVVKIIVGRNNYKK